MANFASSSRGFAEKDEKDEEEKPETAADVLGIVKTGPKKLAAGDSSSLLVLKNELLKRKDRLASTVKQTGSHVAGKSSLLSTKASEKDRLAQEAAERKARISENERELRREEEDRMRMSSQRLREKAELYERMAEGKATFSTADDTPVDFLVDFGSKKRQREEERERWREEEEAAPTGFGRGPIPEHYHHSEEQRVYGTSHMRLSLNENKRRAEIDKLLEMSQKTDQEKAKKADSEYERAKARVEKVNKIRARQGLAPMPLPTPPAAVDLASIPIPAPAGQHETPEERHARLMKSDREWDRGKGLYTTWIEKERDDRDDEFRPPDSYFD